MHIEIKKLRPTQSCVGHGEVIAKMARGAHKLQDPVPVVRGPDHHFYVIDHHHEVSALYMLGELQAPIEVIHDLSTLTQEQFVTVMSALKYCYLKNSTGADVHWDQLPKHFQDLKDDPYRSLAWQVRKGGGYTKLAIPFQEFEWALLFRSYGLAADDVEGAYALALSDVAKGLPGYIVHD